MLLDHFAFMPSTLQAASLTAALTYVLCGAVGVVIVLIQPGHSTRDTWLYSLPFALSWFAAMICLFSCFALVGIVYGAILQSTRGIISVALGFIIARAGFVSLESKSSKQMIARRLIAAALMTGAVALFLI